MSFLTVKNTVRLFAGAACLLAAAVTSASADSYAVTNLVSDGTIAAAHTDSNLVNAWGLALNPLGAWWVSDNGTGLSTLYQNDGTVVSLVVTIPPPNGSNDTATPTGTVFNGGSGFVVSNGGASGSAAFIFCTEDGTISGWNPTVPPPPTSTKAILVIDKSTEHAIYKGLALGGSGASQKLYVADFHNARVDVFDNAYGTVTLGAGAFVDPSLPAKYAPFNIASIGDSLYVTYALQGQDAEDEVDGAGDGLVDEYQLDGTFVRRVATGGTLNAPWGIVQATSDFGDFSNALLVGNFGDGHINAFDITSGTFLGQLKDADGNAIQVDGLWGLAFGIGTAANDLFFTAGPAGETHGLFGKITVEKTVETPAAPRRGICGSSAPAAMMMSFAGLLALRFATTRRRRR